MVTSAIHAIEHFVATFLTNYPEWIDKIIYFGPIGCRTGFYAIFKGDLTFHVIIDAIKRMIDFILEFEVNIPIANVRDRGNYLNMNLGIAKYYCDKFNWEMLDNIREEILYYPKQVF